MSGKTVVKRSVYNAAQELQKIAEATGSGIFALAEKKMDDCQAAADAAAVRFWRDVFIYLVSTNYSDANVEILDQEF